MEQFVQNKFQFLKNKMNFIHRKIIYKSVKKANGNFIFVDKNRYIQMRIEVTMLISMFKTRA